MSRFSRWFSRSESRPTTSDCESNTPPNGEIENTSNEAEDLSKLKYLLRVSAGPSYEVDQHKLVNVNGNEALVIENEFMSVKLKVRVRDYRGLPPGSAKTSRYFDDNLHKDDQYSIGFSFVPKTDIPAEDVVWGNDFDHPIRDKLPPWGLFNTAFSLVKRFVDPGLSCDAYADRPWLYGPALSCWFTFRVGEEVDSSQASDGLPASSEEGEDIVYEGADGSGEEVRENAGLPDDNQERRQHFLNEENRKNFEFQSGRLYQADFFNPYLDFTNFGLRLPRFSLPVIKYVRDGTHSLRYVFKNKKTGDVYFVVVFALLYGQDLDDALHHDHGGGHTFLKETSERERRGTI